jgi:hypothetical protein
MHQDATLAVLRSLRAHITGAVCLASASLLALFGRYELAAGVGAGAALHLLNLWLLVESGRSLLGLRSRRAGRAAAVLSTVGRLLLMGMGLALLSRVGRLALIAGCGTLLSAQLAVHRTGWRQRRFVGCSGRSSPSSARR